MSGVVDDVDSTACYKLADGINIISRGKNMPSDELIEGRGRDHSRTYGHLPCPILEGSRHV
jgi:hypothetical protein